MIMRHPQHPHKSWTQHISACSRGGGGANSRGLLAITVSLKLGERKFWIFAVLAGDKQRTLCPWVPDSHWRHLPTCAPSVPETSGVLEKTCLDGNHWLLD